MGAEYLGCGVVAYIGVGVFTGHQKQGLLLVEYDESSDSYTGVCFPHNEEFTQYLANAGKGTFAPGHMVNVGAAVRIPGLRRYPYTARPDYAFQFVLPGEDAAPLLAIATANAAPAPAPAEEAVTEPIAVETQSNDTRPMWQRLGFESKQEWKAAGSPTA